MQLKSRSLVTLSLCAAAACSTSKTQPLAGTTRTALSSIPTLPTTGAAEYQFIAIDSDGIENAPVTNDVTISGSGSMRTLEYDVFGNHVVRQVLSDGRQPDTDTELQANARVFATFPAAGTPPQVGARWDIGLPSALIQRLTSTVANGFSVTRPVFSGMFTGFIDLTSPSDFTIARAVIGSQQWAMRPPGVGGPDGVQPGLTAIGVADLAIGAGAFTGVIPLRVAYFADPAETLPDDADWQAVVAEPHITDLYCLKTYPGVPSSLISSIPDIAGAPYPAAFTRCTSH
jgi:hypothetical protein